LPLAPFALLAFAPFPLLPGALTGFLLQAPLLIVDVEPVAAEVVQDAKIEVRASASGDQQRHQNADRNPEPGAAPCLWSLRRGWVRHGRCAL
jgi:hypothetical protein